MQAAAGTPTPEQQRTERFEAFAETALEPVRRYLARRADRSTAEDVLGEVLLVCWRRLDDLPAESVPWAIGIARLQLSNALRSARRRDRLTGRLARHQALRRPDVDPTERSHPVLDLLDQLRPAEVELLRLWAWDGLQPAQIAVVLGVSPNAAAIRLHRARRRLADLARSAGLAPGSSTPEGHR